MDFVAGGAIQNKSLKYQLLDRCLFNYGTKSLEKPGHTEQ